MAKVNFKIGLENFSKIYFPSLKVDKSGFEFLSNILDDVNTMLISHIKKKYNSIGKGNVLAYFICARDAIDENFPKNLKENALAEAHKQVALLQSGCLEHGDKAPEFLTKDSTERHDTATKVTTVPTKDTRVEIDQKTFEALPRPFTKGIESFCQKFFPGKKLERKALQSLAFSVHAFCKMAAERTSKTAGKKEELQPVDLKNVLEEYLGRNVLKLALGEANRCVALYKSGLIEFKPKRKSVLSSKKTKDRKTILKPRRPRKPTPTKKPKKRKPSQSPKRPKPSKLRKTKSTLARTRPRSSTPSSKSKIKKPSKRPAGLKTQKKSRTKSPLATRRPRITMPITKSRKKRHVRSPKVLKLSKKRKTKSTPVTRKPRSPKSPSKPKKRKSSISPSGSKPSKKLKTKTPKVTRRPKKTKPSPGPQKRKPSKSTPGSTKLKKRKTKSSPATRRPRVKPIAKPMKKKPSKNQIVPKLSKKRKTKSSPATRKPRSSASKSKPRKRKPSKQPAGSKPSKKRISESRPTPKQRTKKTVQSQKIAQDVTSNVLNAFFREHIVLEKETANDLSRVLGSVCDALIDICVSHTGTSKELTSEDTKAALLEMFPLELSVHALSVASAAVFKYVNKT